MIIAVLKWKKKLIINKKNFLLKQIKKLAKNVSYVYGKNGKNKDYELDTFLPEYDLDFAEKLYGQDLTNKTSLPEIVIKGKKK